MCPAAPLKLPLPWWISGMGSRWVTARLAVSYLGYMASIAPLVPEQGRHRGNPQVWALQP